MPSRPLDTGASFFRSEHTCSFSHTGSPVGLLPITATRRPASRLMLPQLRPPWQAQKSRSLNDFQALKRQSKSWRHGRCPVLGRDGRSSFQGFPSPLPRFNTCHQKKQCPRARRREGILFRSELKCSFSHTRKVSCRATRPPMNQQSFPAVNAAGLGLDSRISILDSRYSNRSAGWSKTRSRRSRSGLCE